MNFATMKPYLGGVLAIGLLMIGVPGEASATSGSLSCVTTWGATLGGNGTHTKAIPFGCDAINDAPFTFTNVPDTGGGLHDITIQTFEQFASTHGIGGVYISGSVDSTSFTGVVTEQHPPGFGIGSLAQLGVTVNFPLLTETIFANTLVPNALMQFDPNATKTGTILITDLGNLALLGLADPVNVIESFNLSFDFSLNNGINFVLEDPTLNFETFDVANANPLIQEFIAEQSVPEPATLSIFGVGLAGLGWMRRRRKAA